MKNCIEQKIFIWPESSLQSPTQHIITEEPLSIRIQGKPYSVVMRTPGDEIAHVAGFCLGEGIVDSIEDFMTIGFCNDQDTNVVTVTLTENRKEQISGSFDRREYISQTSCGICGKELVNELHQIDRKSVV